ncbi:MAG: UDP-3-O-acyl-N-acetylglucosamine deacetylase [Victivallaceae bacterium]|nr:UDP-3-O-acyl-N-acetylglucosamine deacetylase [Victivallaceae bacterium]MDD4181883.1 UDP-3-O-acyl-N-acetylglucosamine deacetylase [Victivallaceae bacterium]
MEYQQTLKEPALISGIALHTGVRASLKINPAPVNSGIVFRRVDLPACPSVQALATKVIDVRRGTTIGEGDCVVHTVEHILASLHACHVDNAVVDMDGPEPPIADGSARPYLDAIIEAGVVSQDAEVEYWTASEIIYVDGGETKLVLTPCDELRISCLTSFRGVPNDPQYLSLAITQDSFRTELAPARTFVHYSDLKALFEMGLCKGGSLDNAAIIHNDAIICKDEMRFADEIVRHKILDLVGDIFLCGKRVKANIIAIKPGHPRNVELAQKMLKCQQKNSV